MKGFLNNHQIEYVLFHLRSHIDLDPELRKSFHFAKRGQLTECKSKVVFMLSENDIDSKSIIFHQGIPILFPAMETNEVFNEDENGNLIFCQDLLKSIFYLLSGYQEYINPKSSDNLKRFSFDDSVQRRLGFVEKPVVNYYFNFIAEGLERYCRVKGLPFQRKRLFPNYGFLLSHDIDKIDTYDFNYVVYKFKELVGLRKNNLSLKDNFGLFMKGAIQFTGIQKKENPYWNFDFLRQVESERGFKSTFYFLDQGIRHSDAYYSFNEGRVKKLFVQLQNEGCEIGLHGSVESMTSESKMKSSLNKLLMASGAKITGARQHRLLWKHPDTAAIQIACGLQYDTTLGFAAHEGFRNSYCYPFRLFDFENNRMMNIWEFPLNVMDVTLFAYRKYNPETATAKCHALVDEVRRFGGVFSLLFHNSAFDEVTYPGITNFYVDLLSHVATSGGQNILGADLAEKMTQTIPQTTHA